MAATLPTPLSSFNRVSAIPVLTPAFTITVNNGENLQTALNDSRVTSGGQNGEIVLQGGASWTGNFVTPARPNDGTWIVLRGSLEASISAAGTRIVPATHAAFMPKLFATNNDPSGAAAALVCPDGSHGWWIRGIEFDTTSSFIFFMVGLGVSPTQFHAGPSTDGRRYIFDRCYVHRSLPIATNNFDCGVFVEGTDIRITGCVITDVQATGQDVKAIGSSNTQGLHQIENNFLAGTAGGIFYGGSYATGTSSIGNGLGDTYLPKDIVILNNDIGFLSHWNPHPGNAAFDGVNWDLKSNLEVKMVQRCWIEGNRFGPQFLNAKLEGAPAFSSISIDAWNQGAADNVSNPATTWDNMARDEDITIQNNIFTNVLCPLQIYAGNRPVRRVWFRNNLCLGVRHDIGAQNYGAYQGGAGVSLVGDTQDVVIDHNTFLPCTRWALGLDKIISPGGVQYANLTIRNNIIGFGTGGITLGDSTGPFGFDSDAAFGGSGFTWKQIIDAACPGRDFQSNALVNADALDTSHQNLNDISVYAAPRWFPASAYGAHGMDLATGVLSASSPFKAGHAFQATDGTDLGVDFTALSVVIPPEVTNPRTPSGRQAVAIF